MNAILLCAAAFRLLQDPFPPLNLEQRDEPGSPPAPVGFVDDDSRIVFRATLREGPILFGPGLEVEVKPHGVAFDETGLLAGGPAGGTAEATAAGLAPGFYHWRARAVDAAGRRSEWVEFDPSPDPDFGIALGPAPVPPAPPLDAGPAVPGRPEQSDRPGGPAASAGMRDPDGVVALRATVLHVQGAGNLVQLEVEVKAEPAPFDERGLAVGNPVAGTGGVSEAVVGGLAEGAYRWRARGLDHAGRRSAWVEFDADPAADFFVGGAAPLPPGPDPEVLDDETDDCGLLGVEVLLLLGLRRRPRKSASFKT